MSGYQVSMDPAFLAAYQSPNYYQMQNVAPVDNTYVAQQNAIQNVPFTGSTTSNAQKDSGGSTAGFIVGTILTLGAAALCRKAYVKGNPSKGFFSRIGNGFKNMWNSGKEAISKYTQPQRFSHTTINGTEVFTVPNRTNIMRTGVAESRLAEIGVSADAPQILNAGKLTKGITIRGAECTLTEGGNTIIYKFGKNGKLQSLQFNGEDILKTTDPAKLKIKQQVQKQINKHLKGENLDVLTNLAFSHSENGTSRLFRCATGTSDPQLTAATSRYFNVNSDAVQAYAADNPKVKDVLKALSEGKTDGLKIASAKYEEPAFGTFHIENGKIKGLTQEGTFYDINSDRYKNLYSNNKEAFDNVLKQEESKLFDIVRILA